ncbi:MAG: hypothetical protein Q9217_006795 [Psora testacea]
MGLGPKDGVEHGGEDIITDPEMNSIEVDGDGFRSKGGHGASVGGGTEVPGEQNPSDDQVVQAPAHSSYPRVVGRGLRDDHEAAAIAGGSTGGEVEEREITNNSLSCQTWINAKPSQAARSMPMRKELVKATGMGPKEQTIKDIGQKKRGRK